MWSGLIFYFGVFRFVFFVFVCSGLFFYFDVFWFGFLFWCLLVWFLFWCVLLWFFEVLYVLHCVYIFYCLNAVLCISLLFPGLFCYSYIRESLYKSREFYLRNYQKEVPFTVEYFVKEINSDGSFHVLEDSQHDLIYWVLHLEHFFNRVSTLWIVFLIQTHNSKPMFSPFVKIFGLKLASDILQ